MMNTGNVLRRVYGVTAALTGALFFFIVVGVFGLPLATARLAVFVLGAVVVCRVLQPTERTMKTRACHSRPNDT
jgi:hypothetical protein